MDVDIETAKALAGFPEVVTLAVAAAQDAKGIEITALDTAQAFPLCDCFLIVSGRSDRHVQGIANKIRSTLADNRIKPISVEGLERGQWVLLDYGNVLIHVFYAPERERYNLETLWVGAKKITIPDDSDEFFAA
jgi:ribosome-associated protein